MNTKLPRPRMFVTATMVLLAAGSLGHAQVNPLKDPGKVLVDGSGWRLGDAPGDRLRIELSEGGESVVPGTVLIGAGAGVTGVIEQSAGTLRTGGPQLSYFTLGSRDATLLGGYGAYVLRGGRFVTDEPSVSGVRVGGFGLGLWEQHGGEAQVSRWFAVGGPGGFAGRGVVNLLGGTLTVSPRFRVLLADSPDAVATLNLGTQAGGSAELTTLAYWGSGGFNSLVVGHNPRGDRAVLNLNRGRLTLGGPLLQRAGSVHGSVNLNGATLRAGVNHMDLINASISAVRMFRDGITIDTQQHTVALNAHVQTPAGMGLYPDGGWLPVAEGGRGYLAPPLVRVQTATGRGWGASAIAQMQGDRVARLLITNPGQNYTPGDILIFTFDGGGPEQPAVVMRHTLTAEDLASNAGGTLTKIGPGTLHLTADASLPGPVIVKQGTLVLHTPHVTGPIKVMPAATVVGELPPDQPHRILGTHLPHPFANKDAARPLMPAQRQDGEPDSHWSTPPPPGKSPVALPEAITAPYLQNMATDRMVVMAEFAENLPMRVDFGTTPRLGKRVLMQTTPSGGNTFFYRGTLTSLKPGTVYHYRLINQDGRAVTETATFRTAPLEREDFSFTTLGDIQTTNRGAWDADPWEPAKAMIAHMRQRQPRFMLGLGDHADDGNRYDRTRLSFLNRVPTVLGPGIPFFIAWGNHDGRDPLDPLRRAADMPSRFRTDSFSPYTSGYGSYAFSYSDVFFVAIEHFNWFGQNDPTSSDLTNGWLDMVLSSPEAQNARFRVVAIHWPTYCERYVDGNAALRMHLAPRLKHYNVELCLSGHMHGYFRGQRDDTHYVVTGTGSYLGAKAPLTTDWPHMIRGGFTDVPGRYAVQSEPGQLGPPQPITGGLFHGYGEVAVRGNKMIYTQHGFNADGSYIGVLDTFVIPSRTEDRRDR